MPPLLEAPEAAPSFGDVLRLADDPTRARVLRQISVANGNSYVQRLLAPSAPIQREDTPVGTPVAKTELSSLDDAVKTIYETLEKPVSDQTRETGPTGGAREKILREMLDHRSQAAELQKKYTETYKTQLLNHIQDKMGPEDALRASEYLANGQLRSVAKLLLAMNGLGTDEETAFRVLTDAHREGTAEESWRSLVAGPQGDGAAHLTILDGWKTTTLDAALESEFSGNELDKAKALLKHGEIKGIAKIRIGTNKIGTDTAMVFQGLKESNRDTVREDYKAEYREDLDELLFGSNSTIGELSGDDADYARLLLSTSSSDPNFLVGVVKAAVVAIPTNSDLIFENVGKAAKQRDSGSDKEKAAAKAQLDTLAKQVDNPADPLGLKGWTGDLSKADNARLRALLGLSETSTDVPGGGGAVTVEVLNDELVKKLRGAGGVEKGTILTALMKVEAPSIRTFAAANSNANSPLHTYISANSDVEEMGKIPTVLTGGLYERLRLCGQGGKGNPVEYALALINTDGGFSTADERIELRKALRAIGRGETPKGDAGTTMGVLNGVFSGNEMGQIRSELQKDQISVNERSAELDEDVKREDSGVHLNSTDPLEDEKRQVESDTAIAGQDATMTPEEEAKIREGQSKTAGALQDFVAVRDEYTGYLSQAISFAVGLLIAAGSGGAAGPAVIAALLRAAVASGLARAVTEKALKGERFDLLGPEGARIFLNGAVDGAMNVVSAGMAQGLLKPIAGEVAMDALKAGTATAGLKMVNSSIEGGVSGAIGGTVDAVTNDETWRKGAAQGMTSVISTAVIAGVQGAALSGGIEGAKIVGGKIVNGRVVGGKTAAGQLFDAHPMVGAAKAGDDKAAREILKTFGTWQNAIDCLNTGKGVAETMTPGSRAELKDALVANRKRLLEILEKDYGAKPVGQASTEAASDVDLNVPGEDAGKKLLAARKYLDELMATWQQSYRMALLVDASRVGTYSEHLAGLPPAKQAEIRAQVARKSELYSFVRQVRAADPEARPAMLAKITDAQELATVKHFVELNEGQIKAEHDAALLDGDAAMQKLKAATDDETKAAEALKVTEAQMLANMLNDDAYISPAAVGQFAGGKNANTNLDRFQAALDQFTAIGHQVHENHGVLGAMRRYEVFKYIQRFCDLAEASGLITGPDADKITFFRNWAELFYRVEREASSSALASDAPRNPAASTNKASVRDTEINVAPRPGTSDRFLLENYNEFKAMAERTIGVLNHAGNEEISAAGGKPGPGQTLVDLPSLTAEDQAALNSQGPQGAAVTAAGGPVVSRTTTNIAILNPTGQPNQPIGRPVANEDAARTILLRLGAGETKALTDIGVPNVPADYNTRGKEWGIARTKDGAVIIIEGKPGAIDWQDLLKQGIHPVAHSHPIIPERMLKQENRTLRQLIPLTSNKVPDAVFVLPSVEDFTFAYKEGLASHQVFTPYAHLGEGLVGNPAEGLPLLNFYISGIEKVGNFGKGTPPLEILKCTLFFADTRVQIFDSVQVWIPNNNLLNDIYIAPPPEMVPLPPKSESPGKKKDGQS